MSSFQQQVSALTAVPEQRIAPLASGSLSEVLLILWPDGRRSVAKSGPDVGVEADMLRALDRAGVPAPQVKAVQDGMLRIAHVENDGAFTQSAWADIGARLRDLHRRTGPSYGWDADYAFGRVPLDNRRGGDWPRFWAEQRLVSTAQLIGGDWLDRVETAAARIGDLLPAKPAPALLHGDLWTGNILVRDGKLAALIDPACYHGDAEVDLAMLDLFASPGEAFRDGYGPLEPGWRDRRPIYQLFPALVHLRLFGSAYSAMVDRMLARLGA